MSENVQHIPPKREKGYWLPIECMDRLSGQPFIINVYQFPEHIITAQPSSANIPKRTPITPQT